MIDSPTTCIVCKTALAAVSADGLCDTCRAASGNTPNRPAPRQSLLTSSATRTFVQTAEPSQRTTKAFDSYVFSHQTTEPHRNSAKKKADFKPNPPPGYLLNEELGIGGSAEVYRAVQLGANRECAIKFLKGIWQTTAVERLEREVRAIAGLEHPNIIRIYACHLESQPPSFVMEYAAGGSLADRMKAHPKGLPVAEAVKHTIAIAEAVAHAHAKEIVHRDVKPGNVLLDANGAAKISDFGLARNLLTDPTVTRPNSVLGTPAYMSPEQAHGKDATKASDVYSIGAVLYDLLVGQPPFANKEFIVILDRVKNELPAAPRSCRKEIHPDLEAVCLKCLEKDPAKRYASALDLAADLGRYQRGESTVARPLSLPAKTWRRVKRHRRVLATAAMVIAAVLIGATVLPKKERQKTLVELQTQKENEYFDLKEHEFDTTGKSELIGSTELPAHYRVTSGNPVFAPSRTKDGTCEMVSIGFGSVELMRAIKATRYRISAQVRQTETRGAFNEPKEDDLYGFYFGSAEIKALDFAPPGIGIDPEAPALTFFTVTLGEKTKRSAKDGMIRFEQFSQLRTQSDKNPVPWPRPLVSAPLDRIEFFPGPWKSIEIDVSPERVLMKWKVEPADQWNILADCRISRNGKSIEFVDAHQSNLKSATQPIRVATGWPPNSGFGIWSCNVPFSIRSIMITTIPLE